MKTFNEWKESHLEDNPKDQNLGHSELMEKFNEYIKTGLKKNDEPKREGHVEKSSNSQKSEQESSKTNKMDERVVKLLETQNEKLFEITFLLKAIRLGIFLILLLAFILPWIISTLWLADAHIHSSVANWEDNRFGREMIQEKIEESE